MKFDCNTKCNAPADGSKWAVLLWRKNRVRAKLPWGGRRLSARNNSDFEDLLTPPSPQLFARISFVVCCATSKHNTHHSVLFLIDNHQQCPKTNLHGHLCCETRNHSTTIAAVKECQCWLRLGSLPIGCMLSVGAGAQGCMTTSTRLSSRWQDTQGHSAACSAAESRQATGFLVFVTSPLQRGPGSETMRLEITHSPPLEGGMASTISQRHCYLPSASFAAQLGGAPSFNHP